MKYTPNQLTKLASKRIKSYLPPGYNVVLFGSWAKGTAVPTSDIDLGVVGSRPLPLETVSMIRESLDGLPTIRKIDFVDLQLMSPDHRQDILNHAKTL